MVTSIHPNLDQQQPETPKRARAWLPRVTAALTVFAVLLAGSLWYLSLQLNRSGEVASGAPTIGGPFTLINAEAKPVTDRDFLGKYMLIYFGYTFCPDVCPTTLAKLTAALEQLGPNGNQVQSLFITVDPKRDTPALIGQYMKAFSPRLIGLTGSAEQIAAVEKEYRVYAAEHRTGNGPNDYTMDHSSIIYLMGPDGRFVAIIPAEDDANAMAAAIGKHLS